VTHISDQPLLIGEKRAIPDAKGNWSPVSAFEGWRPEEPVQRSGWWVFAAGLALVVFAIWRLKL
jgi:hypothetical protein